MLGNIAIRFTNFPWSDIGKRFLGPNIALIRGLSMFLIRQPVTIWIEWSVDCELSVQLWFFHFENHTRGYRQTTKCIFESRGAKITITIERKI